MNEWVNWMNELNEWIEWMNIGWMYEWFIVAESVRTIQCDQLWSLFTEFLCMTRQLVLSMFISLRSMRLRQIRDRTGHRRRRQSAAAADHVTSILICVYSNLSESGLCGPETWSLDALISLLSVVSQHWHNIIRFKDMLPKAWSCKNTFSTVAFFCSL